jgi:sodium/potassium-transporting ATPase subunit alpha
MEDKTPADLVLIGAMDLKINNSSLIDKLEPQEQIALLDGSKHCAVETENLVS